MTVEHSEHVPRRLWLVLAGLTLVWGFNWTAMKVAISEIAPLTFRTLCLGIGAGVLFGCLRASRQPLAVPRDQWGRLVLIAFFSITCWNLLVVFGLRLIPSGRAAILAYTMPAWAIPLSVLILGERITARKLAGLGLGMAGMLLLVWDEFARLHGAPLGAALVLCAAITWAVGTLLQKRFPVRAPVAAYTAWIMLLGGVPIYIGALLLEDFTRLGAASPRALAATAYNALFAFAWGHWAWIRLATSMSVTAFSLSMLVIPVVGVFSGMLFLGERPGWAEYAALAFVLGSLATVVAPQRPPR
ncbi:MAG TPA: EamA family transporter [Burkholderiales bacterium]|nr:EamA family transporter [Burkholderiales bacterium]